MAHTMTSAAQLSTPSLEQLRNQPEIEMLLQCARARLDAPTTARMRTLVTGPLDWDALYTGATRHGLLPLLHWHLSAVASDITPVHVLREFRREFEENAARSFVLTAELLEILSALQKQDTHVATYKGPALALSAYGNLLLRPFCDLDLLMARCDLPIVRETLIKRGYVQQFHSNAESIEYAHSFVKHGEEGGGIVVEAHWSVTPHHYVLPPVPYGAIERLRALSMQGQEVLVLSPEDQVLVLCWHGYKHRWSRLEWVACIAEILRRSDEEMKGGVLDGEKTEGKSTAGISSKLDWQQLHEAARRAGSLRLLWLGLGLAHELLNAPLPDEVRAAMRADRVLARLLPPLQAFLLVAPGDETSRWPALKMFRLSSRERWRDKARYCWRLTQAPRQMRWQAWHPANWRPALRPPRQSET